VRFTWPRPPWKGACHSGLATVFQKHAERSAWWKPALLTSFFASGASGLILELVWTRQFALVFGNTEAALSAVLAAYMAGLAGGSYLFGRRCRRWRQPICLYARLELGIAFSSLTLYPLIYHAGFFFRGVWLISSPHPSLLQATNFLRAFLLLGVPTTLMGGTLPVLCHGWPEEKENGAGKRVGILYGTNLAGAVVGALGAGFFLLPAWGVCRTMIFAAALNTMAAIIAALVAMGEGTGEKNREQDGQNLFTNDEPAVLRLRRLAIFAVCGLSGVAAIIEEVIWSRCLRLMVGSSTYALTLMLVPFLLGLGLGSYLVARRSRRIHRPVTVLAGLEISAFFSLYTATYLYPHLPKLFLLGFPVVGSGAGIFVLQGVLAAFLLLPLATLLGALFPMFARVIARDSSDMGPPVGKLYAVQTCGNVLGAVLAIFWITHLGLRGGLLAAGAVHLAASVVLWLFAEERLHLRFAAALGTIAAMFLAFLIKPDWQPLYITSGVYQTSTVLNPLLRRPKDFFRAISRFHLLFYREGATATVSVYELPTLEPLPHIALAIDGKVDASTGADMATQVLSAHLPLLLHPDAKHICVVGWASGVTVGSALLYPVKSLTAIEIEPAVISASLAFDQFNHRPLHEPRLRLLIQDARNVFLVDKERYDVIISEPSNPWLAGPAQLFTREFVQLAKSRLNSGGLFAQWIQLYGLTPDLLRSEVRTFHAVFPYDMVFQTAEGDLLLLGRDSPTPVDYQRLAQRMANPSIRDDLARVGVHDPLDLLLPFRLGWREVSRFTGPGPLNTDDNGLLEFGAPRSLYRDTLEENTRLLRSAFRAIGPYVSPPNPELPVQLAQRAIRRGDWEEAEMFGREVSGLPSSAGGEWVRGEIEWKRGNQITAQEEWQQGLLIDPNHFGCLMDMALAAQQLDHFRRSEKYLTHLSRRWPHNALVAVVHGVNRLALYDTGGAEDYFKQARKQGKAAIRGTRTGACCYRVFLRRFIPLHLLASFYGWQTARLEGNRALAVRLQQQAVKALERWRASLLSNPSPESRSGLLDAVSLLSNRAQSIGVDRPLMSWLSQQLLEPLSHYDRALSLALLGDTQQAQEELARTQAQVTDGEGRKQIAIMARKLGIGPAMTTRTANP
jgi:spermidine synthase